VTNVLQVENLNHLYAGSGPRVEVLRGINLSIAATTMTAVKGDSGCGKTTLLLACGAMQKPTNGNVLINQQSVFQLPVSRRSQFRASQIGYLFQTLQLIPYLSVLDNVRLVRGVTTATAKQWLTKLGLNDRLRHRPHALSHGQRQRVALARALAHRPALVIADEPTGNLDPANTRLVFETLREFADAGGAVLIASHDPTIDEFADQVQFIESGTLVSAEARS
jgi:putative ABC transport system ATP-binding protein